MALNNRYYSKIITQLIAVIKTAKYCLGIQVITVI